jgi:hypothetical protein
VRTGFAHRRKTLRNNFRNILDSDEIRALDIDEGMRAEQLDYPCWTRLANAIEEKKMGQPIEPLMNTNKNGMTFNVVGFAWFVAVGIVVVETRHALSLRYRYCSK